MCALSIARAGLLAATLAAPAAAQFAGLSWTTAGGCAGVAPDGILLEVCVGAGCGSLASASATLPQGGFYRLGFTWESDDDCCATLQVRVAGKVVFEVGNVFGPICPGAPPCSATEEIGFEAQVGDTLELVLWNSNCFVFATKANFTSLVLGPPLPPVVSSVDPACAWSPSPLRIHGQNFTAQSAVQIGGVPATVTSWMSNLLTVDKGQPAPGFPDLVVATPHGTGVLSGGAQLCPTLSASASGVGGTLAVDYAVSSHGLLVIAVGVQALDAPLSLGPDVYYGLLLDLGAPHAIVLSTVLDPYAPATGQISVPIPPDPALSGVRLNAQGLSKASGLGPPVPPYSFTNLARTSVP